MPSYRSGSLAFSTPRTLQMINGTGFATGTEFAVPLGWGDPPEGVPQAGGGVGPNENDISTLLVFFIGFIRQARLTAQAEGMLDRV